MPAALATAPPLGASTTSMGTPLMKSVNVDEIHLLQDGARKPVLMENHGTTGPAWP